MTIGCVPIEDGPVEELYLAAIDTRIAHGGTLEVHMLPGRLDDEGVTALVRDADPDPELLAFWMNLKEGYDLFEATNRRPRIRADKQGRYRFTPAAEKRASIRSSMTPPSTTSRSATPPSRSPAPASRRRP